MRRAAGSSDVETQLYIKMPRLVGAPVASGGPTTRTVGNIPYDRMPNVHQLYQRDTLDTREETGRP